MQPYRRLRQTRLPLSLHLNTPLACFYFIELRAVSRDLPRPLVRSLGGVVLKVNILGKAICSEEQDGLPSQIGPDTHRITGICGKPFLFVSISFSSRRKIEFPHKYCVIRLGDAEARFRWLRMLCLKRLFQVNTVEFISVFFICIAFIVQLWRKSFSA